MKKLWLLFPVLFAVIFVYLFKSQQAGVNVLLFNLILIAGLSVSGRMEIHNRLQLLLSAGALISSFMVLLYGSSMAMAGNVFSLILLMGVVADNRIILLLNGFTASVYAIASAPFYYLAQIFNSHANKSSGRRIARFILVFIAPLLVLFLFILLYANASPFFNKFTGNFMLHFRKFLEFIYEFVSPDTFWIFVGGLLISLGFLYGKSNRLLVFFSEEKGNDLFRLRKRYHGRTTSLKTEYRSGIVLLVLLNVLIAIMNVLDIYNVWFFFEWNGDFLKQFVHEGTWLLIFSIIISIAIVLYYFRGNLNYYPRRRLLLSLAILWMAQNALLVFSVGIRNMWYIQHFNLAFKRIGVYAFLLLTLFGIATVMFKILNRKSHQYLFHYNGIAAYVILISLGFFNWDKVIATYNIRHADTAFFHPEFMASLNSSALPELQQSLLVIGKIEQQQFNKFDFARSYMPFGEYENIVTQRCNDFIAGYPLLSWQGWNFADYQTYRTLQRANGNNHFPEKIR
ncbi:MAG: DUF4173 domain-containing protein [Lentimicrobium sp.]|jgi:hypothetical protein|nr:DUF4173 domain-containing protein [Lentimicrobium sp.]